MGLCDLYLGHAIEGNDSRFTFSPGGTAPYSLDDVANNIFGSSMGTTTDGFGFGQEGITYHFSIQDALGCIGAVTVTIPPELIPPTISIPTIVIGIL